MKRISLTLCLAFLTVLFCQAQVAPLKFNKNGEFKIVQFTDIHFQYHNPASAIALKRINEVLAAEHRPRGHPGPAGERHGGGHSTGDPESGAKQLHLGSAP